MLFEKRHKKAVRAIWMVLSILIILSMLLLFGPISLTGGGTPLPATGQQTPNTSNPNASGEVIVEPGSQDVDDLESTLQF